MHARPLIVRTGLSLSVAGLVAAALSAGAGAQTPGFTWTHDLMMQKQAYTHAFPSGVVSAPEAATAATSGPIVIKLGATGTKGVPATIPAGYTTFDYRQNGKAPRDAEIAQLKAGYTIAQAKKDSKASGGQSAKAADALVRLIKNTRLTGGAAPVGKNPAQSGLVTVNLTPGSYYFVNLDDNTNSNGVFTPFTVTATGKSNATKPAVAGKLTTHEYGFTIPAALKKAGKHTFEIGNTGAQGHIMVMAKLPDGTTADQFGMALASDGPPPPGFEFVGDLMGLLTPGQKEYKSIKLSAGTYGLVCFMPEQVKKDHSIPHFAEGMITTFDVK